MSPLSLGLTEIPRHSFSKVLLDLGGCGGKLTYSGGSSSDDSTDTALSRISFFAPDPAPQYQYLVGRSPFLGY